MKCILEASFMSGSYAASRVRGVKDGVYSHSTLYMNLISISVLCEKQFGVKQMLFCIEGIFSTQHLESEEISCSRGIEIFACEGAHRFMSSLKRT